MEPIKLACASWPPCRLLCVGCRGGVVCMGDAPPLPTLAAGELAAEREGVPHVLPAAGWGVPVPPLAGVPPDMGVLVQEEGVAGVPVPRATDKPCAGVEGVAGAPVHPPGDGLVLGTQGVEAPLPAPWKEARRTGVVILRDMGRVGCACVAPCGCVVEEGADSGAPNEPGGVWGGDENLLWSVRTIFLAAGVFLVLDLVARVCAKRHAPEKSAAIFGSLFALPPAVSLFEHKYSSGRGRWGARRGVCEQELPRPTDSAVMSPRVTTATFSFFDWLHTTRTAGL